jgi:diguanylate cyclase (GGDEF)-like protein
MQTAPTSAPAAEPGPPPVSSRAVGSTGIVLCSIALVLGGAALWFGVVTRQTPVHPPFHIPWIVFVVLFALSEVFVVHLHLKRETHTLSLNEIPVVLGLFFVNPAHLLTAHLVGSGAALMAHRRQHGIKLLFNLSMLGAEALAGYAVFRTLLGSASPLSPRAWLAAVVATIVIDAMGAVLVTLAIYLYRGTFDGRNALFVVSTGVLFALANASLGLLAVEVIWHDGRASILFTAIALVLFVSYRSYAALHDRYRGLELLQQFTRVVSSSLASDDVTAAVLHEARELLRSERAEMIVHHDDGRTVVVTLDGDGRAEWSEPRDAPDHVLWQRIQERGEALLVTRTMRDDEALRAELDAQDMQDLIAAPLVFDGRVVGMLVVANRFHDTETFKPEDLRLFQTLANHASVSLQNGRLVDELRIEAAEREHQALHDPLTGLPNRRYFSENLDGAIDHARASGEPVAVLLLDLDRFKEVNDTLGHPSGDRLLREVATRLLDSVRDTDTVARLGGDEFALLLPGVAGAEVARAKAEDLLSGVAQPYQIDGLTLEVDGSIGIALFPHHGHDAATLMQRADVAMYAAKETHTGCQVYSPGRDHNSAERLALAAELREAITNHALEVHFQPFVDLSTGQVRGAEALVRWKHPTRGMLPPDEFIPIAEHTGLIRPLTMFVLVQALRRRQAWAEAGYDLSISVNVSMRDLVDANLPQKVAEILAVAGTLPEALTLEVTESQLMSDPERCSGVLRELSEMGVRIAIDDFGTGFSSLVSLRSLPVDVIKVDKSFVLHMATDDNDDAIVRSTVDLGRSLGLRVVAEGVENEVTVQKLRQYGCHDMQGYYLSRPLPADAFDSWLTGRSAEEARPEVSKALENVVELAPKRAVGDGR